MALRLLFLASLVWSFLGLHGVGAPIAPKDGCHIDPNGLCRPGSGLGAEADRPLMKDPD